MSKVTESVEKLITPILEELNIELVEVEFAKEGRDYFLRIFIDKENGVDIEDCGNVSERVSVVLDEVDPITHNYFLEVSSPGAERPLKKEADWLKAIGKNVYIKTYEPIENNKVFEGVLTNYDGEFVTVDMKIKTRTKQVTLPFAKIASARLAVVFS